MNDSVAVVPVEPVRVDLGVIRADKPADLVKFATEAANALAGVIDSRKLYSNIQGKKFVKCEGWTTLAAMLGVTPHEIGVTEVDGAFTATVELRRLTDGQPVSRASAECGPDEKTWAGRPRYARRSMALTRATAKACRLAFSWIMALSGYEVTPAEEIPHEDVPVRHPSAGAAAKEPPSAPAPAQPLSEKPAALQQPEPPMPWDHVPAAWRKTWPFGSLKGKELHTLTSDELVAQKAWALKSGKALDLVDVMDEILASRQGE